MPLSMASRMRSPIDVRQPRDAVDGGLAQGQRDAQVDDLAATLGDLDPDRPAGATTGRRGGRLGRAWVLGASVSAGLQGVEDGPGLVGAQAAIGDEAQDRLEGVIRHGRSPPRRGRRSGPPGGGWPRTTSMSPRSRARRMSSSGSSRDDVEVGGGRAIGGRHGGVLLEGRGRRRRGRARRLERQRDGLGDAQVAGRGAEAEGRRARPDDQAALAARPFLAGLDVAAHVAGDGRHRDVEAAAAGARVASPLTRSPG